MPIKSTRDILNYHGLIEDCKRIIEEDTMPKPKKLNVFIPNI